MAELALSLWALVLAVFDLKQRRLPNALTLGGVVVGGVILAITGVSPLGQPPGSILQAVALAVVLTLPAYVCGLLGAGDVKFAVAIAVLTGLYDFAAVYALSAVLCLGGLLIRRCLDYVPYAVPGLSTGTHPRLAGGARHPRNIRLGAAMGGALSVVMLVRLAGHSW